MKPDGSASRPPNKLERVIGEIYGRTLIADRDLSRRLDIVEARLRRLESGTLPTALVDPEASE